MECPVENLETEVDLRRIDGDRRRNAEDAEAASHDAGHHAELQAFPGDTTRELGRGRLGPAVLDQVETEQQSAAAYVADALVTLLQGAEAGLEALAEHPGAFGQPLAQDDLDDLQADGGWQRVGGVRGIKKRVFRESSG